MIGLQRGYRYIERRKMGVCDTCGNCGTTIGALEEAYVWKITPVCAICYARLTNKAAASPDSANHNVQPSADTSTPKVPVEDVLSQIMALAKSVLGLALVVIIWWVWRGVSEAVSPHSSDSGTPQVSTPQLPSITIVGDPEHCLIFSNWTPHFASLSGTLVWGGGAVDTIEYTVKRNGVVKDRGTLSIPGGIMKKNEPMEVSIPTAADLDPATEITITAHAKSLEEIVNEDPVIHAFVRRYPDWEWEFKHLRPTSRERFNNMISLLVSTGQIDLDTANYVRRFLRDHAP